jgi:PAS domain S-box-containing protein
VQAIATTAWQAAPVSALLVVSAALALLVAIVVWHRGATPGARPCALLLVAVAEWAATAALEHAAVDPAAKIAFARLEYLGIVSVPPLWLMFAFIYTGRGGVLTPARVAALWVVPLLTLALAWTNHWHGLVWPQVTPRSPEPGAPLVYGHGPAFWAAAAYNYVLNATGAVALVSAIMRGRAHDRRQAMALGAGLAVPWLGNAVYLLHPEVLGGIDPTPVAFTITGVVYAFGVFRLGLFDLLPVARDLLIEGMADGVVVLDGVHRVVDLNPSARAMLGLAQRPVLGAAAGDVFAACPGLMARYGEAGDGRGEVRVDGAEGTRDLEVRISPLRDGQGRLKGRLVVLTDVTARKRTEAALRENERLASLGQLLAGVAHELNNPLAVIAGHATLMQRRGATDPATAERADKIATAADRCRRIIENFLLVARHRVPERTATALNPLLRGAVDDLAPQLERDGVTVVLELADGLPHVWADGTQIYQVIVNLLTNAVYALRQMSEPRRLTVASAADADNRVSFRVADTGPGIPAEQREHLFEPFFTTKPVGVGSGLGLSVCRGIITAHGGTIEVASPRGGGTEFVVRLPGARDQAVAPAAREVARSGDGVTRVLVIEEDAAVRDEVVAMLAADRLHVEVAADSKTAMDKLEGLSFDVVVTDVSMPLLDVYDLYRTFREHPQLRRRIVFVSGHPLDRDARDFVAATGVAVLTRPFDAELLRRAVAETRG